MVELPCVEELQVDGICPRWREENAKLSLPGLETALNALPRLRDLDIYNASFYGDLPENIAPCDVAHNLRLRLDNSHLWGHYFSRKYTHLRSLDISPTQDIAAFTSEAKMLVRSCRRLERLEANFSRMRSIYRECLEILKEIGAPLVSLDLDDLDDIDPHEYETLISAFHETVSAIKFTTRERRTAEEITGPLKACRNLTSLRLRCAFSDIELDYCLACCKRLKRLEIAVNTISVAENFTTDYKHGLEKLNIVADDIADDLFPYLLQHCPLLHKLECDYNPKCNRSCDIYIPSPRLAYLRVEYSNNCIFKVTQEAKAEHPSSERSETKSNNQTLWYCQKFDEAVTFRKLDSSEIDRLVGQQCKDDDGCGTEKSERSSKPREPPMAAAMIPYHNGNI
ncbi:hypothetical protein DFQ28_010542 [Apophysomyces sp. BC1034]|nr:hypothetical protein DFQ28_010542 [Apophysomyces sp. BC1034]